MKNFIFDFQYLVSNSLAQISYFSNKGKRKKEKRNFSEKSYTYCSHCIYYNSSRSFPVTSTVVSFLSGFNTIEYDLDRSLR